MAAHKKTEKRDYYNSDIKEQYLDYKFGSNSESEAQRLNVERMFEHYAKYEKELNKDASCFTSLEIKDTFKQMGFVSVYLVANYRSQLSNYTQWCINRNLVPDFQNHYLEIKNHESFVNKIGAGRKIVSRDELLSAIERLDNACDMFALLCLFEGINGKNRMEITTLHMSDIDEDKKIAHLRSSRNIKVSDKLIELAKESSTTDKYTAASGRQITFAKDEDPDLIFKNFGNVQESSSDLYKGRRLYFRLDKALQLIGFDDLSVNSVSDSGKIHTINTLAKEHNITGAEVLLNDDLIKIVEEQFGIIMKPKRSTFIKNYEMYLV